MTGFDPRTPGVRSDSSTNGATTTATTCDRTISSHRRRYRVRPSWSRGNGGGVKHKIWSRRNASIEPERIRSDVSEIKNFPCYEKKVQSRKTTFRFRENWVDWQHSDLQKKNVRLHKINFIKKIWLFTFCKYSFGPRGPNLNSGCRRSKLSQQKQSLQIPIKNVLNPQQRNPLLCCENVASLASTKCQQRKLFWNSVKKKTFRFCSTFFLHHVHFGTTDASTRNDSVTILTVLNKRQLFIPSSTM